MGFHANPELLDWFIKEYPKHRKLKLDMRKSCVLFKKMDKIPFELIGKLMRKWLLKIGLKNTKLFCKEMSVTNSDELNILSTFLKV